MIIAKHYILHAMQEVQFSSLKQIYTGSIPKMYCLSEIKSNALS